MSTTPNRRLHEDSGSGDQGTYLGVGGKVVVSSRHDAPDYMGLEGRMPMATCNESRDGEMRSPKTELRDSKHIIKDIKVGNRDLESESMELHQTGKCDEYDSRADEDKDVKPEQVTYSEPKGNEKLDDGCVGSKRQLTWKYIKEHSKQYPGVSGGKEGLHVDNGGIAGKSVKQESSTLEPKKKDHDTCKNVDREARNRKKEKVADLELERPDKRSKYREKEMDEDGGEVDVSCGFNKIGEYVQELIKLWKEYELLQADKACEGSQNGPTLEIRIPVQHVTATNPQVKSGQLWGTDVYTVDSNLVAGYCRPTESPAPSTTEELRATIRLLPPQDRYISTLRNCVRSRAWIAPIDCSYCVESCCFVKKGGGIIDLEPHLAHSSATFAPVVAESQITTRAAASKTLRKIRFMDAIMFQYSFCMEPWYEYKINAVADQGLKTSLFSSARLKKGEVLYVETRFGRYELCFNGEKAIKAAQGPHALDSERSVVNVFRWSRCKRFLTQKDMLSVGIPLPLEYVEVLEENLEWEDDILWSHTGVYIAGREYHLARALFLSPN